MLDFATLPGCLTARLTRHFGEELPADCGHCGPCLGEPPGFLEEVPRLTFEPELRALVKGLMAERHKALATPRQLARFLCGLASPATTRARLAKDPRFGSLADFPFSRVLKLAQAAT
jgi:ATP-dependent DNA helicase RecQ